MAKHDEPAKVWRMRAELDPASGREPDWPRQIRVRTLAPADAEAVHSLLAHGCRGGGGSVTPFEAWLPEMTADDEFDSELWFLAESRAMLVGVALCWSSAFVKNVVVRESWRRRGHGEALLRMCSPSSRRVVHQLLS